MRHSEVRQKTVDAIDALQAVRRNWSISDTAYLEVFADGDADLRVITRMKGKPLATKWLTEIEMLSPEALEAAAKYKRIVRSWMQGEVDDLPASDYEEPAGGEIAPAQDVAIAGVGSYGLERSARARHG